MKELASIHLTLFKDREVKKIRISVIKGDRIFGFIKPIDSF